MSLYMFAYMPIVDVYRYSVREYISVPWLGGLELAVALHCDWRREILNTSLNWSLLEPHLRKPA